MLLLAIDLKSARDTLTERDIREIIDSALHVAGLGGGYTNNTDRLLSAMLEEDGEFPEDEEERHPAAEVFDELIRLGRATPTDRDRFLKLPDKIRDEF